MLKLVVQAFNQQRGVKLGSRFDAVARTEGERVKLAIADESR